MSTLKTSLIGSGRLARQFKQTNFTFNQFSGIYTRAKTFNLESQGFDRAIK